MFSFFMSSRRRPLVPVFLWASVCSLMYGRFCFHHIGLVLTKGKERLQWCPNTVLYPMWVGISHMRDHFPKFARESTRTDENSSHVWE